MSLQNIMLLVVVVTSCICLVMVFVAPFFGVTMPTELTAFVTNIILLLIGGGAGAGLTVYGQRSGAEAERMRLLGIPKTDK